MTARKILCFYFYLLILGVCSADGQDSKELTNVQFIKQQLEVNAGQLLDLDLLNDYHVIVLSGTSFPRNEALLEFWQNVLSEVALKSGKRIYRSPAEISDQQYPDYLDIHSTLQQWTLTVDKEKNEQFIQKFRSEMHILCMNNKKEVLLSTTLQDSTMRTFENRDQLFYAQSEQAGFKHTMNKEPVQLSDIIHTIIIAGAALSSVVLLYNFRSQ
ncbi:MAG: hypothetical protein DWQ05_11020 [Calditrichaeota bacterium]|nr:MAG: hypothetical protein DWQ05_11020 [Calditrichota bacterium]